MGRGGQAEIWRRLLEGWTAVAGRFGAIQTLVVLGIFFLVLIGPPTLGAWVSRSDFLQKRRLDSGQSAWCNADSASPDLERAQRMS